MTGADRIHLLDAPHVAPLTVHVRWLRALGYQVPDFDPLDGGCEAKAVFLLESLRSRAVGTRFISRDNPAI